MNRYSTPTSSLSRRAVLRGLGATLALPWLESLAPLTRLAAQPGGITTVPAGPPRRFATVLFANGVNVEHWWARGAGDAMELSPTLQSLAPFRRDMLVMNKLEYFGDTSGPHWPQFTNFLSGASLRRSTIPDAAESVDQMIARHVGRHTFVPSLNLGIEPVESGLRLGVPAIYYSTVSWSAKNNPIPPEIYPRAAYDRLFDVDGLLENKSVLDAVLSQTRRVRRNLDGHDRAKLEEFSEGVRSIEQRIARAAADERLEGWRPTLEKADMDRPPEERPQDYRDHMKIMLDLLVLALQMDRTRVVTLVMNNDVSRQKFDFIEGVRGQMHGISHHQNKADRLAMYQKVNAWHVEHLAYLMERMRSIDEGNGTLLDNTMLLFGSNMMDGDIHDGRELPLILAGGRNCEMRTGRVVTYEDPAERELCNLHLAIAQRMGCRVDRFGDSTMPLPNLT